LPPFSAEPRLVRRSPKGVGGSGEAQNETEKREYSTVLAILNKIRTFSRKNPDAGRRSPTSTNFFGSLEGEPAHPMRRDRRLLSGNC